MTTLERQISELEFKINRCSAITDKLYPIKKELERKSEQM